MTRSRRLVEQDEIRTALAKSSASENVGRLYCEELIAASRDVVKAYIRREKGNGALHRAVIELQKLVGGW